MAAAWCSCVSGSTTSFSLIGSKRALLHQVQAGKQEDPNQVDEVPVQADHFDAIGVPLPLRVPHLVAEEEEVCEHHHAAAIVPKPAPPPRSALSRSASWTGALAML